MNAFLQFLSDLFNNRFFQLFLIILAIVAAAVVIDWIVRKAGRKKSGGAEVFRFLAETAFIKRVIVIGVLLVLTVSVDYFSITAEWKDIIRKCIYTLVILFCYLILNNLLKVFFAKFITPVFFKKQSQYRVKNLVEVTSRFSYIILLIIAVTVALNVWGVQIGPILTGLGIAGIAIGLALQDTLTNIFGGITLALDDAYSEDDCVELSSGESGLIYSIGYRSTKIKTFNEEILVVPNNKLSQMIIRNLSRPTPAYRLSIDFSTEFGVNVDYVKNLLYETVKNTEGVMDFPDVEVYFMKMGGYALDFRVMAFIRTPLEKITVTDRINTAVYNRFIESNIQVPVPASSVTIRDRGGSREDQQK